ncbi:MULTISPECIES: DEAD/DEAH box helicase [Rhodanobacter]|uniref:DNA/RNA helicase, superfamily II, SNF2 family n=1 Tax=Rhodanobacter denitrificans TaxID=666685 RepID=M4NMB9_9GAMM|nr:MULTISPECIES: DEAD/DEAH box helicase [Rhodanobacter]AGG90798.1 DNA/RNA helicase, superfamily II, SNF2 family [Rhodanobacter denitrificans]UJM86171.1 DEAD/DEAH box helicase [Rhodanobacter denitrificans]
MHNELTHLLQRAEWRSNFGDRTLERARAYAADGSVSKLRSRIENGVQMLSALVDGSHGEQYECRVDVHDHSEWLTVDCDCSCPVGVDCKHAAAMLMVAAGEVVRAAALATPAWLQAPRDEADAPDTGSPDLASWEDWLRTLQPPAPSHEAEPDRRFGVMLRGGGGSPVADLLAWPAWLRPSKRRSGNELVDPQPLQLNDRRGAVPTPPGGWSSEAAAALTTLIPRQYVLVGSQRWAPIRAVHEEQALEYLLAHFPVWFERGSAPLQRAEPQSLQLYWHEATDGSQQLRARIDAGDSVLLRGAGLWYVQPAQGRYGRVDGDLHLLDRLPHAPVLQPPQVAALRQRLQRGGTTLPEPIDRGPVEVVRERPVPVLRLRSVTLRKWAGKSHDIGIARVDFDYAGVRLPPATRKHAVERSLHEGRLREIHRDLPAEQQAVQLLEQLGAMRCGPALYEYVTRGLDFAANDVLLRPHPRKPPLAPRDWRESIDRLAAAGFRIEYEAGFPHDELVDIDAWHADIQPSGNAWFDVSLGIDVGGQRVDLLPILRRVLADPAFPRVAPARESRDASWRVAVDENRSVEIPLARLRVLIEPLLEWLEGGEALRLHRSQARTLQALADNAQLYWRGGDALRAQLALLERTTRSARAPKSFKATLRPYQREGLAWLDFLGAAGLGGILADDMGLGKTVQVLAHILGEKQRGRLEQPALVVAPTSLVGNWQSEAARFAPALKVLVIHGIARADRYDEITSHDLIITTYPLLPRDREQLLAQRFALLVLDEAQAIKNAKSQAARVVREIPATRRLAMTGTPLENHLGELWAQFDAVEPGLLGSQHQFTRLYRTPIEKHGDVDRQQRLNRRIGPLLLRRRKDDVLTDLPPKTEIVRTLELEDDQRALYETLRLAQHERVRQAVAERGLAQSGIVVLDALLKLRQACCDPRLVKLASAKKVKTSAKLDALLELLDGLLADGRRVLLFSQFTEMLSLIEAALHKRGVAHQTLTGQTPARERTALVKRFQQGNVPLFLISLKAGGVGLNLTAADTVIHYDPWWNPAVEAQATDRAHRIGQDKPVFVYRLICKDTVEEKIQAMQGRKAELARAVLEGGGASTRLRFDEKDLEALFGGM